MNRLVRRILGPVFLTTLSFWGAAAAADEPLPTYYLIPERAQFQAFQNPLQVISESFGSAATDPAGFAPDAAINLLSFEFHATPFPVPQQPYNRKFHFGLWVNDPRDNNCYDTRAKVLMRDSKRPVVFRPNNHCSVLTGEWHEPYAGKTLFNSTDVQIDHVVALKNAYVTGAHRWDFMHRCLYANFIWNDFHLLSVDGPENMRKGDKSPAEWMPSDRRDACGHIFNWLRVKLVWGLVLGPRETAAISNLVKQAGCDMRAFRVPASFLAQQRALIQQNLNLCSRIDPGGEDFSEWDN